MRPLKKGVEVRKEKKRFNGCRFNKTSAYATVNGELETLMDFEETYREKKKPGAA